MFTCSLSLTLQIFGHKTRFGVWPKSEVFISLGSLNVFTKFHGMLRNLSQDTNVKAQHTLSLNSQSSMAERYTTYDEHEHEFKKQIHVQLNVYAGGGCGGGGSYISKGRQQCGIVVCRLNEWLMFMWMVLLRKVVDIHVCRVYRTCDHVYNNFCAYLSYSEAPFH